MARELVGDGSSSKSSSMRRSRFGRSTPLPEGLYKKARAGEIKHFTGIDSPYEPPEAPDLHLPTLEMTIDDEVDRIIETLQRRGVFD